MNTHGTCPNCQGKLSLWAGLKAPTPLHLRCPHCKSRLRIAMPGLWPSVVIVLIAFFGLAIGVFFAWKQFGETGLLIGLAIYLLAWFVAEIGLGLIFYTCGTFTVKVPRKDTSIT